MLEAHLSHARRPLSSPPDIKVREPDFSELVKSGRRRFLPPRFMTIGRAIRQLLCVEARRRGGVATPETRAFGVARVGQETQLIRAGTLAELARVDFGAPLHSLVLVGGPLHELEEEMARLYAVPLAEGSGGGGGGAGVDDGPPGPPWDDDPAEPQSDGEE
jgi:diphthine synthase